MAVADVNNKNLYLPFDPMDFIFGLWSRLALCKRHAFGLLTVSGSPWIYYCKNNGYF